MIKQSFRKVMAVTASMAMTVGLLATGVGLTPASAAAPLTTFKLAHAGTYSVSVNGAQPTSTSVAGAELHNGAGQLFLMYQGQKQGAPIDGASITETTLKFNLIDSGNRFPVVLKGNNWQGYSGSVAWTHGSSQNNVSTFTSLKLLGAPSGGAKTQKPVKCEPASLPKSLPAKGTRVVLRGACWTNAKKRVKISLRIVSLRGEVGPIARLVKGKNGRVSVRTYGRPGSVKLTASAPKAAGFKAFKKSKTYRLRG